MVIRLGTRGSMLALAQTEWFARRLSQAGHEVELVRITTEGDMRRADTQPGEGMFVTAIARALQREEIDAAVHSAKDVPLVEESGLVIAAYPVRADPRDALVTREGGSSLSRLPRGATVGTDSPRRSGFLRVARPDLRVVPLHGNVDTRLRRLDAGEVDAIVIAAAGLDRLAKGGRIDQRLEAETMPPAPAQGALAVQARNQAGLLLDELRLYDDRDVRAAVEAERRVLEATGGTCRAPVGALASVTEGDFTMIVGGVNSDGSELRVETVRGLRSDALRLAAEAGERLAREVALR
jgi:hydroxymethylbilane synthase